MVVVSAAVVENGVFGGYPELADFHELVSVAITSLGERLAAVLAAEGPQVEVRPHVVHHVAQLGEGLGAGKALQGLVLASSLLVQVAHLSEAPLLVDSLRGLVSRRDFLHLRHSRAWLRLEGFLFAL